MKTKKSHIILSLFIVLSFSLVMILIRLAAIDKTEASNEERPDQEVLAGDEKALFEAYLLSRQENKTKGVLQVEESAYANGKITGSWSTKTPVSAYYGYRVDNSAYDSLRNIFYVISYAGHIYRLEYEPEIKWTLLNHKVQLNPPDNGSANPIFMGTLLPDSTFRLIRSYDEQGRMEYSDDEGRNWTAATGANLSRSWSNQAYEITNDGNTRIILHTYYNNYHHVYVSTDNGESYLEITSSPISTHDLRIVKPHYTNEVYMLLWGKNTKNIDTYKFNPATGNFELTANSTSTVQGTNLSSIAASFVDGTYHFYLSTINTDYTVYYSSDEGTTWQEKNAGRDRPFEIMCAHKPNILISGFEDMKLSTDYGASWTGFDHELGWDLQHMRTYMKAGGTPITLLGQDFGCYISETPEDKYSYTWCNVGATYAMHYDAVTSENFNSIYMGNQDRGTTAYLDEGTNVNTVDVDGTDVLRVCYANHEVSTWSWFYYGRIKHRYNFPGKAGGEAVYDGLGDWWAAPIIASPDPSEDAIYAAYGSNLHKFTYNEVSNSISHSTHPFNFQSSYGQEIAGFGYSKLNRKLWYVALNNGTFLYSKDGGNSWNKFSYIGLMPRANDQAYNYAKNQIVIKASEIDTNKVYYAGVGNYLMISEDAGKKFTPKITGLNVYRIRDFDISPDEKFIFAACGYGGAWVYSVEDDYWYQMSDDPVPSVDFTDVQFIKKKNIVRFSTYGSGILDFKLDQMYNTIEIPDPPVTSFDPAAGIRLEWSFDASSVDGFYIERADTGDFVIVDTLAAGELSWLDSDVGFDQQYYYRIRAFRNDSASYPSLLAMMKSPETGIMYQGNWEIIDFSSQEVNGEYAPAEYAIDNNPATFWHTQWQGGTPSYPHHISIDIKTESLLRGFRYLPRQDGTTNGTVASYELYVSNDPDNWGDPVAKGNFASNTSMKQILFNPVSGRYVKFLALSEINNRAYANAAEISLLYQEPVPLIPQNLTASLVDSTSVKLQWSDISINETGFVIELMQDGEFIAIDTVDKEQLSYLLSDLEIQTTYEFRLRSINNSGLSEATESVSISTEGTFVGRKGINAPAFSIYPNPCQDLLQVAFTETKENISIKIYSLNGQLQYVRNFRENSDLIKLELDHLQSGYYILELESEGSKYAEGFLKK